MSKHSQMQSTAILRQLRAMPAHPGCTVPFSVSPRLAFTFGLSASEQLRARLKYSRAGAPATSTSGVVKKRHEAERDATCGPQSEM